MKINELDFTTMPDILKACATTDPTDSVSADKNLDKIPNHKMKANHCERNQEQEIYIIQKLVR